MKQFTECFAEIEGFEFLVFSSDEEGVAVWSENAIRFFDYGSIDRIWVRERLI